MSGSIKDFLTFMNQYSTSERLFTELICCKTVVKGKKTSGKPGGYRFYFVLLVYSEGVNSARDPARTKKRHEQRSLRVALSVSVLKHETCGQRIIEIVAEQDVVPYEVVDGTDTLELR